MKAKLCTIGMVLFSIFVTVALFCGLVAMSRQESRERQAWIGTPASADACRSEYMRVHLKQLNESQLFGGASSGWKGGNDIYQSIKADSVRIFPEGVEYRDGHYRTIYSHHGMVKVWSTYYRYVKD